MQGTQLVGADVGGTNVKYRVQTRRGRPLAQGDIATDPADARATVARLHEAIRDELPGNDLQIAAVGMACAGIVDPERGTLGRSPNLPGWENASLFDALRHSFGDVPLAVANDVNAALWGEYRRGAGRGARHLVMIALGTGVGGGVIVGSRLVTGHGHGAGEIGHMTLDLEGPLCPCGNRGCLEAYCGSHGLLRRARELATTATPAYAQRITARGDALTTRDLYEMASGGDATALRVFAEAGRRLGQAVASLVNVLAPDRVIIGGGVAQAGDLLLDPCRHAVDVHVLSDTGRQTPVVLAELGPHAAAIGAAELAARKGAST